MTLVATEPATGLVQTFQAEVAEQIFGRGKLHTTVHVFIIVCLIIVSLCLIMIFLLRKLRHEALVDVSGGSG